MPEWHKENMGGYKMINLKQDIANVIRKMMFVDGDQANAHTDLLISIECTGIEFNVRSCSLHNLTTNRPTKQDKGYYISTDA